MSTWIICPSYTWPRYLCSRWALGLSAAFLWRFTRRFDSACALSWGELSSRDYWSSCKKSSQWPSVARSRTVDVALRSRGWHLPLSGHVLRSAGRRHPACGPNSQTPVDKWLTSREHMRTLRVKHLHWRFVSSCCRLPPFALFGPAASCLQYYNGRFILRRSIHSKGSMRLIVVSQCKLYFCITRCYVRFLVRDSQLIKYTSTVLRAGQVNRTYSCSASGSDFLQ